MKTILKFLSVAVLMIISFALFGQDTTVIDTIVTPGPEGPGITLPLLQDWFTSGFGPVMSVLVIVFGYLSKYLPWIKFQNTTLRVFAFAILLGAGYFAFGGDIWQVALSYASATSFYELILKQLFPSKEQKALNEARKAQGLPTQ